MVKWALTHKQRVKSANEVPEAKRPKPCIIRTSKKQWTPDGFSQMLRDRCPGILANTITNLVKIFGASDLISGIVPGDLYTVHLPSMKSTAGIIPVPDMERFNPKPPFGETVKPLHTPGPWSMALPSVALHPLGLILPAGWEHHKDPKKSAFPTFGLFGMCMQMNRGDSEIPRWIAQTLVDRAAKRGKVSNQSLLERCTVDNMNTQR